MLVGVLSNMKTTENIPLSERLKTELKGVGSEHNIIINADTV